MERSRNPSSGRSTPETERCILAASSLECTWRSIAQWRSTFVAAITALALGSCISSSAGEPDSATVDTDPATLTHNETESVATSGTDSDSESFTGTASDSATFVDTGSDTQAATLGVISVEELASALAAKDFLLVNVHVPYEGEIPGTDFHISYLSIDELVATLGPSLQTKVVVYCKTNSMALIAGNALVERGYRQVRYLDGGMVAWTAAGHGLDNREKGSKVKVKDQGPRSSAIHVSQVSH